MKKKTIILTALLINAICVFSQEIYEKPVVDERVELMSIVFRLAGNEEYVRNEIPMYVNEVDKYFEKYKKHPLIKLSTALHNEYGVSFDAIATFSLLLEMKDGKLNLTDLHQLDKRWNQDSIPKYMRLLNDFYQKTNFHNFFENTKLIREKAEANFAKDVTDNIDFEWFKKFFGYLPEKKFRIFISLANGPSNYGPTIIDKDGKDVFYQIMGSWQTDKYGFPKYGNNNIITLVHEISHSFCNPSVLKYQDELLPQSTIFFNLNEEKMRRMAYGNPISFMYEILVRACVIQYDNEHNKKYFQTNEAIAQEVNNGFLWLPQLWEAIKEYEKDTTYKTLRDFMPEIVKLQNSINPQQLYDEMENDKPIITGTNILNNCDTVDYNIDNITIYFDKPMFKWNTGIIWGGEYNIFEETFTWEYEEWNEEQTEWTFSIKLKPNVEYEIGFPSSSFVDLKYRHPKETYTLTFKTKPSQ
jgi:hypothetical protein